MTGDRLKLQLRAFECIRAKPGGGNPGWMAVRCLMIREAQRGEIHVQTRAAVLVGEAGQHERPELRRIN